uniref:Uncharacterized protein n=1 Tax=Hippocampus comes TaxID=109280 RepID=A0A3Q2Y0L6_HIPCM
AQFAGGGALALRAQHVVVDAIESPTSSVVNPHLKGPLGLGQGPLQPPLDLCQRHGLSRHVVHLVAQLRAPEGDVVEALADVLAGVLLHASRQLLLVLDQAHRVTGDGAIVLVVAAGTPLVGVVASGPRVSVAGRHGGDGGQEVTRLGDRTWSFPFSVSLTCKMSSSPPQGDGTCIMH